MADIGEKRVNIGVALRPATVEALDAASERTGRSRASVLEILIGLHAAKLTADTRVPAAVAPVGGRAKRGTGRAKKPGGAG